MTTLVASEPVADSGSTTGTTLSRNETESLCAKAARGAGYSWGLAEEAGFAAGWLAAQGIDGTGAFLALLTEKLTNPAENAAPRPTPGHWQSAAQRPLCPITLGAALTDCALLADGPFSRDTRLDPVMAPLLLVPFLARAAQMCDRQVLVDGQDGQLLITSNGAFDGRAAVSFLGRGPLALTLRSTQSPEAPQGGPARLPLVSLAVLEGLNALALRTTVPATDASRRGAGSSTTDND